jgi:hypothetical protein
VLTIMTMEIIAFWDVMPCSLINVIDTTEEHDSFALKNEDVRVQTSSVMSMETAYASEISVNISKNTRRHISEVSNLILL